MEDTGSFLNLPAHSWLHNLSLLNAPSLMAMRQASSSFLHLIDNSDDLWNNLAINPPSSHLSSKQEHTAFMELTDVLHKGTNLTPAKHNHISQHLEHQRDEEICSRVLSEAYHDIFLYGQEGLACLSLPLLLSFLVDLPLRSWLVLCTLLTLVGCFLIIKSLKQHDAIVDKFFEKTSFKTSWCRTHRFGVIYPGPFHPIVSLYTVFLVTCALCIYAINPALVFDYYFCFIALGVVLALNLYMNTREPYETRNRRPYPFHHEHFRGLPRQLPTPPNNHIIYATLQSTLVPVFLVAPILLHLSNKKYLLNISHLPLAWAYILLLISGVVVAFYNVYKLLCGGDYRWWWISFWAPTISVTIAGLLCDLQLHSFLIGILLGSLAGTLSHAIIWWNLIGSTSEKARGSLRYPHNIREFFFHKVVDNFFEAMSMPFAIAYIYIFGNPMKD